MSDEISQVVAVAERLANNRKQIVERAVPTASGGRETYQWRDCDADAEPWVVFRERYSLEERPAVWKLGRAILATGATLVLDPSAPERFDEDAQLTPDSELIDPRP